MNATHATAIPSRTARPARPTRRVHTISAVASITTGLAWVVLTVAMSLAMLNATFGYSASAPAAHPPVVTAPVDDGAASQVTVTDAVQPEPGPAPIAAP